jgi:hypothetical protein
MGEVIVLDTAGPIVYIGRLTDVGESTFVLEQADIHDCRDGHVSKDAYVAEARDGGVTVNRRRIIILRTAVISVSLLRDIVIE